MKWYEWIALPLWAWAHISIGIRILIDYSEKWWCVPVVALIILTAVLLTITYTEMVKQYLQKKGAKRPK